MSYETFLSDLSAVRDRAGRYRRQAGDEERAEALVGALEELDVTLEELRVAEEEVRTQQESLSAGRELAEAERERYQALFLLAPAAYLLTDPAGLIREANLRAVALLWGAHPGDRLGGRRAGPGRQGPELRWLLWPPPEAELGPVATGTTSLAMGPPPAGPSPLDDLAATLHEVVDATAHVVGADGSGLMMADAGGALRWVTATGEAEQAFERAQRDLGVLSSPVLHDGKVLGTCTPSPTTRAAGPTPTSPPSSPSRSLSAGCWRRASRPGTRATWPPSSRRRWSGVGLRPTTGRLRPAEPVG